MTPASPLNQPRAAALGQASDDQRGSGAKPHSEPRLQTAVMCLGAVALLYTNSFYTRDWRTVVSQPGLTAADQRPARPKLARTGEATPSEAPVWREPEQAGALPNEAEPVAMPAQPKSTPSVAVAAPKTRKEPAPARVRLPPKPTPLTQLAEASAGRAPLLSPEAPALSRAPIQFQLAERSN